MGMYRYMLLCALLVCSMWNGVEGWTYSAPCSQVSEFPVLWLNSTTQSTSVIGNEFTVYSNKPDGSAFLGTWQRMKWYEVTELELIPSISNPDVLKCVAGYRIPEDVAQWTLRALDFENSCMCKATTGTRPFKPGITEQFVDFEVTRPDWPGFSISLNFSLVDHSWSTIVPASPETFMLEYPLNWTANIPKVSFQITNWNWTTGDVVNSSLRLWFHASTQADEDTELIYSEKRPPFITFTTNTTNAFFETSFLRAFAANGIDYVVTDDIDDDFPIVLTKDSSQLVPFAVSLCHGGQPPNVTYSDLFYDPTIVALFTGPYDPPTDSNDPQGNKNKSLHPAAYAVPIAIVVVVIGVAAVAIFVPSVRHKLRGDKHPFADQRNTKRQAQAASSTPTMQATPDNASDTTPASTQNGWARSQRPTEPI